MVRFAKQFATFSLVGSAPSLASNHRSGVVDRCPPECSGKYSPRQRFSVVALRGFRESMKARVEPNEGLTNGNDAGSDGDEPHLDARATRSGCSLRSQHGSVEPEDEAVHLRRA